MVVIRLSRGGAKKRPFYHLVVTDSRNRRDGRCIERVGYFDPQARGQSLVLHIDKERVQHWLSQGAKTTERVATLLKKYEKAGEMNGVQLAADKAVVRDKKQAIAKAKAEADAAKAAAEAAAEETAAE